jgi:3-hydroxyacyl-[acyl-carrier-protein] dehydratase
MIELRKQHAVNKNETTSFDLEKIKTLIPHRYPMLMIDRVTNIVRGESAIGIKCVTNNEPFFQGHFPKKAVMPGVLIVEAMAQTAAVVVIDSLDIASVGDIVYFMSIESARFRKPVCPGDKLELHVQMIQNRKNVWKFEGKAIVDNVIHANATYTAMIMDNEV